MITVDGKTYSTNDNNKLECSTEDETHEVTLLEQLRLRTDCTRRGIGEGFGEKRSLEIILGNCKRELREWDSFRGTMKKIRRKPDGTEQEILDEIEEMEAAILDAQAVMDDPSIVGTF
tara:strand:+ start:185 stop:538 length:354 start_codon:yes stop_codon:yes gene_type:complete